MLMMREIVGSKTTPAREGVALRFVFALSNAVLMGTLIIGGVGAQSEPARQRLYIADTDQKTGMGKIVALEVDPLTGIVNGNQFREISTVGAAGAAIVQLNAPHALAVEPTGGDLYATTSMGILIVNTEEDSPVGGVEFIELQNILSNPGRMLAFSRDGRILYAATGDGIAVFNVPERMELREFAQLPAPYLALAEKQPLGRLRQRQTEIRQHLTNGISGLAVSQDGRTLYVATVIGQGRDARSAIVPIDIDLYSDAEPSVSGLQSDLSRYLTVRGAVKMSNTGFGGRTTDQPKDVAISADGQYAYLLHGAATYSSVNTESPEILEIIHQMAFTFGFHGGYNAVVRDIVGPVLWGRMQEAANEALKAGVVLVNSPGTMGVFSIGPNQSAQLQDVFATTMVLGSRRPIVQTLEEIYAKRPFAVAIRPNVPGKAGQTQQPRALVAFFQTGNFGVLDQATQGSFHRDPEPPPGAFKGYIGKTTNIPLDKHLWPLCPEDLALMYPIAVEYAQNGRFAVGAHSGTFGHPAEPCNSEPEPDIAALNRGAISIIDDWAISDDLGPHVTQTRQFDAEDSQSITSYYSLNPICREHIVGTDRPLLRRDLRAACAPGKDVVTHVYEYGASGPRTTFHRPRGIAIQPFVTIDSPRFGDHVALTTAIQVRWRDPRATAWTLELLDPANDQPLRPPLKGDLTAADDRQAMEERSAKTFRREFHRFFPNSQPTDRRAYKIRAILNIGSEELSRTDIVVTFEQ
jgi:hypothetical protein